MYWAGRDGREIATVDVPPDRWVVAALSPDGRLADAIMNTGTGVNDVWVIDLARGVTNRITNGKGTNNLGTWSPDSKVLLYGSNRRGPRDIYRRAADGSGGTRLMTSPVGTLPKRDSAAIALRIAAESTASSQATRMTRSA